MKQLLFVFICAIATLSVSAQKKTLAQKQNAVVVTSEYEPTQVRSHPIGGMGCTDTYQQDTAVCYERQWIRSTQKGQYAIRLMIFPYQQYRNALIVSVEREMNNNVAYQQAWPGYSIPMFKVGDNITDPNVVNMSDNKIAFSYHRNGELILIEL